MKGEARREARGRRRPEGAEPRPRTARSALLAGLTLIAGAVVLLWYAPDSYTIYKALHVMAIVIWVGGDIT